MFSCYAGFVLAVDIPVTPENVDCLETVELLGLIGTKVA